jgi:toxin secretion/phage lysis holin
METFCKMIAAIVGAVASTLWGGWSMALQTLFLFVTIDYMTGLLASSVERKLSSQVGFKGITRKVMIFAVVTVAHLIDQRLGGGHLFRDGTISFYICNETLSIMENIGRMGLPIPDSISKALEVLKGRDKK